jgi:HAD superfamily hydrolase (TIGR01509 family)
MWNVISVPDLTRRIFMLNVKGVIFDMDGLMIDTEKFLIKFWCQACEEFGYHATPSMLYPMRSLCSQYAEQRYKAVFGQDFDVKKVRARRVELMNEHVAKYGVEKKKGLDELLDFLKANGIKRAVATATDYPRTEQYLKSIGVFEKFDNIVCATMVKIGKPEPYVYLQACEEVGLQPNECIALEDSPNGVLSAYRAGCKPIMVPDLTQPDDDTKALLFDCVESLDKVIEVILKG